MHRTKIAPKAVRESLEVYSYYLGGIIYVVDKTGSGKVFEMQKTLVLGKLPCCNGRSAGS